MLVVFVNLKVRAFLHLRHQDEIIRIIWVLVIFTLLALVVNFWLEFLLAWFKFKSCVLVDFLARRCLLVYQGYSTATKRYTFTTTPHILKQAATFFKTFDIFQRISSGVRLVWCVQTFESFLSLSFFPRSCTVIWYFLCPHFIQLLLKCDFLCWKRRRRWQTFRFRDFNRLLKLLIAFLLKQIKRRLSFPHPWVLPFLQLRWFTASDASWWTLPSNS